MRRLGEAASAEDQAAEAAIRLVPEWSGAAVRYDRAAAPIMSPMHKAVDSECYAVDVNDAPYFLKIIHPEMRAAVDLAASFEAAGKAAACGVAPAPRHCLPAGARPRLRSPRRGLAHGDGRRPAGSFPS